MITTETLSKKEAKALKKGEIVWECNSGGYARVVDAKPKGQKNHVEVQRFVKVDKNGTPIFLNERKECGQPLFIYYSYLQFVDFQELTDNIKRAEENLFEAKSMAKALGVVGVS